MCSICDLQTRLFHGLYGWNLKRNHIKNLEISLVPPGIKPEQKFCVRVDDSIEESEDWATAFHGTSMKNLPLILEHGLRDSPEDWRPAGVYVTPFMETALNYTNETDRLQILKL